jgi:hypothetical protein
MERQAERDDGSIAGSPPADERATEQPSSGSTDVVTLEVPPQSRYIRLARLVAAGLANELGFDVDRLDDVRLAIGEVCGLAVQQGATSVALSYVLDEATLEVEIDAPLSPEAPTVDEDHRVLVEQVLAVACSTHRLANSDRRISALLTFTDGR